MHRAKGVIATYYQLSSTNDTPPATLLEYIVLTNNKIPTKIPKTRLMDKLNCGCFNIVCNTTPI